VRVAPSSFARARYSPIALDKVMIIGACPSPSISRMRRMGERLQPLRAPPFLPYLASRNAPTDERRADSPQTEPEVPAVMETPQPKRGTADDFVAEKRAKRGK
jgi:hypothetical protein